MRTAYTWIALAAAGGITCSWRTADAQEQEPAAGPESKIFSNGQLSLVIREARRNGRSEFWIHQVQLKMPNGWQTILDGVDGGEFSTSLGGANATRCETVKNDATGVILRMSCKQDTWEAEEVIELAAGSQVLQRKQTYRFLKPFEGAIHPGFRVKAEGDIRYTFPVKADEQPLAALKGPIRAAVEHALPLPFHIWHNRQYVALYGLDKSVSPGTIDFSPVGADGRAALRVYYPDSCPEEAKAKFIPPLAETTPQTTKIAEGTELTLTEIFAARPLAAGELPLLEADRIAASILLRKPGRPVDLKAAADGIAGFFKHCELWEPNALGPGRGWFRNMWTRTCTGSGGELKFNGAGRKETPREGPEEFNGHYDLTWGEGYAVYNWTGIVRHWKRTGDTDLLRYVDEMTRNMELFKRGSGPDEPYYDRRQGRNGPFADYLGRKVIWTHLLGRIGSETIKLYQSAPDYPNPRTRNQWLTAATGIGNFLAKHQQANGDLQDTFDENNRETLQNGRRCSARAIVCGLWIRLGQVTGDKAWTERALRLAKVVAPEVKRYEFFNAHVDHPPCPDVEATWYVLDGLIPLYEATRDPEVLAACKAAAAQGISWTYFYDVPIPMTHNGVARGGQLCCTCTPIIFVIGPGIAVEPLLALSKLTGDSFYRQMAAEMASYIGHSQIDAPGKPWHGGVIHAFLMYCGKSHGPDREGQVDTGMATGASLAALEARLADPAERTVGIRQANP
jgi:hypothetical protein